MTRSAPSSEPTSLISLGEKAACAGPRRPRIVISRTVLVRSVRSASSVMSLSDSLTVWILGEDAHHVHRDVAVADDRDTLGLVEVEVAVLEVGMAVVPADELGGRVHATELLAVDAHRAVGFVAGRVDDAVVVAFEIGNAQVTADHDVAEEAEALIGRGLVVDADDVLDLLVVGRDAATHETKRCGQSIEQIGRAHEVALLQSSNRVEPTWTRTHDRDAQRSLLTP